MNVSKQLFLFTLCTTISAHAAFNISVEPETTLAIGGQSELDRTRYFSIATGGTDFGKLSAERFDYYVNDLGICFGRHVNLLSSGWQWGNCVYEDPDRPGYVDIERMKQTIKPIDGKNAQKLKERFPENLKVIGTENFHTKTWPGFMETRILADDKTGHHPMAVNVDAAAEGMIAFLKYGFTDWTRPAWYEGLNEPDWFFVGDEDFAQFHLKALDYARHEGMSMKVGGPCFSTGQFFRKNYQQMNTFLGRFIDDTQGKLDFYSFHPYNYMYLDEANNTFIGRYTAGLPIDGVIDSYANYTTEKYDRQIPLLVSEHGAYLEGKQEEKDKLNAYADKTLSGSGWELEMKKRSIHSFMMVNGAISYTMSFMNQPHIVEKSVPFILLDTSGWNPKHYAALMVSENYEKPVKRYHESRMVDFYKFFKNVQGRRINSYSPDPDIQHQAFVDGDRLILLFNNLAETASTVNLRIHNAGKPQKMVIRRLGRNRDLTPYFTEKASRPIKTLTLAPDESVAVFVKYAKPIAEQNHINEVICYGNKVATELHGSAPETYIVPIPDFGKTQYGIVRVSVSRPNGTDRKIAVTLNGKKLDMPMEDCVDRIDATNNFASQYGSLKYIKVAKSLLKPENTIKVSFPDGKGGGIGSVIIRAGQLD